MDPLTRFAPPVLNRKKRVVLLGATGSIGENTLRVIAAHSDRLELVGIAARQNSDRLVEIARQFSVRHLGLYDPAAFTAARARQDLPADARLYGGPEGLVELACLPEADLVLVGMVGTRALHPTLAAIEAGKTIALANKEILVLAGKFMMAAARRRQVRIFPVDSEHSAVFQCLEGSSRAAVDRIYLTASGGSLRHATAEQLASVTPAQALKHPNWSMGPKITVDSATLANKGLELIEAQWLFDLRPSQLECVIHPQSIIHALVRFADGSLLAQLAPPSMTFPIQYALLHPERLPPVEPSLDLGRLLTLEIGPPDFGRFPCLALARQAMEAGGLAPAIYNAANEVAVAAFLAERVPFLAIPLIIDKTLQQIDSIEPSVLEEVLEADARARRVAGDWADQLSSR